MNEKFRNIGLMLIGASVAASIFGAAMLYEQRAQAAEAIVAEQEVAVKRADCFRLRIEWHRVAIEELQKELDSLEGKVKS